MLNEELTFQKFGYYGKDLTPKSGKKVIASCDKCNKVRELYKHAYKPFCRKCCTNNRNKGNKYSEESKQKISLAKKGYKYGSFSEEHKKKLSEVRKGIIFSKETLLKMSLVKKGKKHTEETKLKLRGSNSPHWKGGISPLVKIIYSLQEHITWRTGIFKRDYYTCQKCTLKGGKLEAHHKRKFVLIFREFLQLYPQLDSIKNKKELVELAREYKPFWDINNGETLCLNCHTLVENKKLEKRDEK